MTLHITSIEDVTVAVHPIFYPDSQRWEIWRPKHYTAKSLRELQDKLGPGYVIHDWYPDGYDTTFRTERAAHTPHELIRPRNNFNNRGRMR